MDLDDFATPPKIRPIGEVRDLDRFLPFKRDLTHEAICLHCGGRYPYTHATLAEDGFIYCAVIDCDGTFIDLMPHEKDDPLQTSTDEQTRQDGLIPTPEDLIWSLSLPQLTDADIEALYQRKLHQQAELDARPKLSAKEVNNILEWLRSQCRPISTSRQTGPAATRTRHSPSPSQEHAPSTIVRPKHRLIKKTPKD